jgi:hypothetical protein
MDVVYKVGNFLLLHRHMPRLLTLYKMEATRTVANPEGKPVQDVVIAQCGEM